MGNEISQIASRIDGIKRIPQIQSFLNSFKKKKVRKVLLLSLDAAGKTSILYRFKLGKLINTIPTIGYNHEEVKYRSVIFDLWDIGGQDQMRGLWKNYFINVQALIFIVDASDRERLEEARKELKNIEEIICEFNLQRRIVLLIFANKQDLPNPMSPQEIYDGLKLYDLILAGIALRLFNCSKDDVGIYEGLDWLYEELKNRDRMIFRTSN